MLTEHFNTADRAPDQPILRMCTPCEMTGKSTPATRMVNGVRKCEDCFRVGATVASKQKEVGMSAMEQAPKDCHCGRPFGHRGIHKGVKLGTRVSSSPIRAAAKVAKRPRADSSMIAAHAELIAKRDSINQLIKLMEEVYGL